MPIYEIDQDKPDEKLIQLAARSLSRGEVIIHPTETVYGLAGLYNDAQLIRKITAIKGRPEGQPFSIMVSKLDDIYRISGNLPLPWLGKFLERFLPGPLTVLLQRKNTLDPPFWNQFPDIGFRYPDHQLSLQLIKIAGAPLITTSANLSGNRPAIRLQEIPHPLQKQVHLILDGGMTAGREASSIIRINTDTRELGLIRTGCIPFSELDAGFHECISKL
jgi:L-threonylcarbamoyladenylate synthase